jgi:hypothetical protein
MPDEQVKRVTRLTPEVYAALEKQLPKMVVTAETTDMQAGMQLGVQLVLKHLREGFVAE